MKNIKLSLEFRLLFWLWIWVFLQIWLARAIVAICAVAFTSAGFTPAVTVTILLCTVRLSTIAKVVFKIYVWSISFFGKGERIFLNDLIDCFWAVHVIMVVFTAVTQTSLKIRRILLDHTFCRLQNMCSTSWGIGSFGSCNRYTWFPFRWKREKEGF